MKEQIEALKVQFEADLDRARNAEELASLEILYFGRKAGKLTAILRGLKDLPIEERKEVGQLANQVKAEAESKLQKAQAQFSGGDQTSVDVTLPGMDLLEGHLHLVTQAIEEIQETFERIGFVRRRYPEVEWDWYAFESLNMPSDHPARDEWETFFIDNEPVGKKGQRVLTPHTSNGQVREMERKEMPIRMTNISKCYRRQSDVSHVPMFHQFEGLYVDKDVTIGHLKGVLEYFAKSFFGPDREIRIRPFHFQFTEPSFEVDVSCGVCNGKGCRLCKEGWLELGGSGMIHPNVLKAGKIDPKKYSGFAFGWGVERAYMMKSGLSIPDIRMLYQNDLRFLNQF